MYIKSGLPEEPKLKIRMFVDVLAYKSHKPYMQLSMRDEWYNNMGPSKQQKDIVLKASIADTGAQCFLLGSSNLNCANSTAAGKLGVFFAEVREEHHETEDVVESRTMVYVIQGDIILVSKAVLETLGSIPKNFPQVGEFLTDDDAALTGRAFAVHPDLIGLMSDGTKDPNTPEAVATIDDKPKDVNPGANAAVAGNTGSAGKVGGTRSDPPEVAGEIFKAAVRQPKGECDRESDLPCSCPRRVFVEPPDQLPMPATASNRKVMEEFIKNHFKAGAFNTCKRQH